MCKTSKIEREDSEIRSKREMSERWITYFSMKRFLPGQCMRYEAYFLEAVGFEIFHDVRHIVMERIINEQVKFINTGNKTELMR